MAQNNNGFVSSSMATAEDIQRRELSLATAQGVLKQVERGLYCLPETWEDEYVITQHRFARGIFSHDTVLYLLGLSDAAPESLTMTFPRGYNTSKAKHAGIATRYRQESFAKRMNIQGVPSALRWLLFRPPILSTWIHPGSVSLPSPIRRRTCIWRQPASTPHGRRETCPQRGFGA